MYRINWRHIEAFIIIFLLCLSLLLRCSSPKEQQPVPDLLQTETISAEPSGISQPVTEESSLETPESQELPSSLSVPPQEIPEETIAGISSIVLGYQEIPVDAEVVDISYTDVKSLDIDMNRVFRKLPNLKTIYMIGCGLTNDEYAALQDSHPEIKIVWEILLSHWAIRTDVVAFTTAKSTLDTFYMENEEAYYLRYCTDLVALDIGHNHVSDLSFLQYLPNLKILILVDNYDYTDANLNSHYLSDLSMLRYCPNLRYLECFANGDITDYSFLIYMPFLEDLNISYTGISNIGYLMNLPYLQRLWIEHTNISYDDYLTLITTYPQTEIVYFGEGSVDQGWRDPGTHFTIVRDMLDNNYVHAYYQD